MHTDRQGLRDFLTAVRAKLRSAFGVNFDYLPSSFYRFGDKHLKEHTPSTIRYGFAQMSVSYHVFDFQIFNADYGVQAYVQICHFMEKVFTLIGNLLMCLYNKYTRLLSTVRAFLFTGKASASTPKYLLTVPVVFRVRNGVTFTIDKETLDSYVNANLFRCFGILLDRHVITGKGDKPAGRFTTHGDSLDFTFDWAGQEQLKSAYVSNVQIPPVKFPTSLFECEGIVPAKAFKAWETCFTLSRLNALKETLVCFIKTFENLLQYLRAYGFKFRVFSLEFRKLIQLVIHRDSLSVLLIDKHSNAEGNIVENTAKLKPLEAVSLCRLVDFGLVYECLSQLYLSLILYVLLVSVKKTPSLQWG